MDPSPDAVVRDLFGQPIKPAAELVPVEPSVTPTESPTPPEVATAATTTAAETHQRLVARCQQLRAARRCPGRCIVTGELGQGGLAAFRQIVDGSR